MIYFTIKNHITDEEEVFIPANLLAEKFNKKESFVADKLKAIMYISKSDICSFPFTKSLSDGKAIYLELDEDGVVHTYSNKNLTEFAIKSWKNRRNANVIKEVLNEFNKPENLLKSEESLEVKEEIINTTYNDMDEDSINIEIFEESGRYLLSAYELYKSLKIVYYNFEKWAKDNIVNNPMYIEGIDYQENETYNPIADVHFFTDYIIDTTVARELIVTTDTSEDDDNKIKVRNYIASFSMIPKIDNNDTNEFIDNLRLNIYHIERYLPSILNWKTASDVMPRLLDRCMEEIDCGNIKVDVFSAVIRTALKIVDKEQDSTKKELLNREITEWMIKRAQIYAGIISSVKTENARLKAQLTI